MDFLRTLRFAHPVDVVATLLRDEEQARHKYAALGHEELEVLRWEADGDDLVTETRRYVPIDVPRFARRVLRPRNAIVQKERWTRGDDGLLHNEWSVAVSGAPIRIEGIATLRPDGDGCLHEIRGTVRCSVPIVGRKIAAFVAKDAAAGVEGEHHIDRQALETGD